MARVTGEAEIALVVKACDRLANMTACVAEGNARLLAMYRKEHAVFRASAHRKGLCDSIWVELDRVAAAPD